MIQKDRHSAFNAICSDVWGDWKWRIANRIASLEQINSLEIEDKKEIIPSIKNGFSVGITPIMRSI